MSEFPADEYSKAQEKWIGKDHIVTPSLKRVLEDLSLIKGKKVLDAGCGNGHYSHEFLEWGAAKVYGTDASAEMIKEAQETYKGENIRFFHQSLQQLELPEKVDVACAIFVLQFLHSKEDLRQSVERISQHLSGGGVFVGVVPNGIREFNPVPEEGHKFGAAIYIPSGESIEDGKLLEVRFYDKEKVVGSSHICLHFRETYEKILTNAGFSKIEWLDPIISKDGRERYGDQFFHSYLSPPKDIFFRARLER